MPVKVTGVVQLRRHMAKMLHESGEPKISVVTGYTQTYAYAVHEIDAEHKAGKQKKYLETPARHFQQQIVKIVRSDPRDLAKGLLRAALFLRGKSQKIVPMDTGALKASAFTALEKDIEAKAAEAFDKSEAKRLKVIKSRRKKAKKK